MYKYLITGGAGLIGSNLLRDLIKKKNIEIYVVDNLWRGKIENFKDEDKFLFDVDNYFFNLDLRNYDNCVKVTQNIDCVIHLADIVAGINYVFDNEFTLFQSNLSINSNMLRAAIKNKVNKYLYVGTACSYPLEKQASINTIPLTEEEAYPANPESSYGWSKLIGEYELELAEKNKQIEASILRLHNVYGPRCELTHERSQVIPALCRKLILNEDFVVWGSGKQRRAFVYIDDIVRAIMLALEKGMGQGVIQIGPDKSETISGIAEKLIKISGKDMDIKFDLSKPEGDFDRTANYSKAKKIIGWEPIVDIDSGLLKTYDWALKYLLNQKN
jgi:nucleoside-diphosphate-sugar epimerase